jgi:hypothetical protein
MKGAVAALVADRFKPCLLAAGFAALRPREFTRVRSRIEQHVLLEGRGVSGARSTYLVFYATHTCRPSALTGFVAGARLDGRPWDLSTPEAAAKSLPEITTRLREVVLPWMNTTSTLDGFAGVLASLRGARTEPWNFEIAVNAVLRGDLEQAMRHLNEAAKGPLSYWSAPESPARQLLASIQAGNHQQLLDEWERSAQPRSRDP